MSLWMCPTHGLYGGQVFCPKCGHVGHYATLDACDSDRSGEAIETAKTGSTEGESAGPKDIAQQQSGPPMNRMIELAERVEKASGPDRELDLLVHMTVDTEYAAIEEDALHFFVKYGAQPAYTASLDAALSLVPEGMKLHLERDPEGKGRARLHGYDESGWASRPDHNGLAATPALALCAAALRSRPTIGEDR